MQIPKGYRKLEKGEVVPKGANTLWPNGVMRDNVGPVGGKVGEIGYSSAGDKCEVIVLDTNKAIIIVGTSPVLAETVAGLMKAAGAQGVTTHLESVRAGQAINNVMAFRYEGPEEGVNCGREDTYSGDWPDYRRIDARTQMPELLELLKSKIIIEPKAAFGIKIGPLTWFPISEYDKRHPDLHFKTCLFTSSLPGAPDQGTGYQSGYVYIWSGYGISLSSLFLNQNSSGHKATHFAELV